MRKRIAELFGEAKEFMGLRRAKFRGDKFIREQILVTAAAQNIKRMVKLLSNGRPKEEAIAAQSPLMASLRVSLSDLLAHLRQKLRILLFISTLCPEKG